MQIATVSTPESSARSQIDGRSFEDARLLVKRPDPSSAKKILIGYTPAPKDIPYYTCVLEMLADGWELLGPPQCEQLEVDGHTRTQWGWWLQRACPNTPLPPSLQDLNPQSGDRGLILEIIHTLDQRVLQARADGFPQGRAIEQAQSAALRRLLERADDFLGWQAHDARVGRPE